MPITIGGFIVPAHLHLSPGNIRRLVKSGTSSDYQLLYRLYSPEIPGEFYPVLFRNLDKVPREDKIFFLKRIPLARDGELLVYLTPFLADAEPAVREIAADRIRTLLFRPLLPSRDIPTYQTSPHEVRYGELREISDRFVALLASLWSEYSAWPEGRERILKSLVHFREIGHLFPPIFRKSDEKAALLRFTALCKLQEETEEEEQLILALTYRCQLHCAYCFTRHRETEMMTERIFSLVLSWMNAADCRRISFTGGEPTLHPCFPDFLGQCRDCGLQVYFNSNGLLDRQILDWLSPDFILNLGIHLAHQAQDRKNHRRILLANLEGLKRKSIPLFFRINLDAIGTDRWEHTFRLCDRFEVDHLRLALCFPAEDGLKRHVAQKDVGGWAERILEILQECS